MSTTSSVTTNLDDYAPGATATITASGFDSGSTVTFSVQHVSGPGVDGIYGTADDEVVSLGGDGHDAWTIGDGGAGDLDGLQNGTVVTTWYVNPDDSTNERFLLTATTPDGWLAANTFTDKATPPADPGTFNGAIIQSYTTAGSTGTGVISSFLRVQSDGYEAGYNTDGRPLQFQENTSLSFTHSITLAQIPKVTVDGKQYYVFNLDLNENNNGDSPLITLQNFKVFSSSVSNLNNMDTSTLLFPTSSAKLLYELDGGDNTSVGLTDWNSGSGTGDYVVYIPVIGMNGNAGFTGLSASTYIYVYTEFGQQGGAGNTSEGGFEEWFVVTQETPAMTIDKTFVDVTGGNGNDVADFAGDVLHYTVTVTNTGNVALTGVTVTDPLTGQNVSGVTLAIGETKTYNTSYTLTQDDIDNWGGGDGDIDNTATADSNETGPVSDSVEVPVYRNPALNIVKDADKDQVADKAGEKLTYTITVENTGNQTLTEVTVSDPNADAGSIVRGKDVVGDNDNLLEVGEKWLYTAAHTVTQDEIDSNGGGDGYLENTATADSKESEEDTDDATVPVDQNPALNIVKDADKDQVADKAGEKLTYTITVENTGNQTLTEVTVSDPNADAGSIVRGEDVVGDNDDLLEVGEKWLYTAAHTVTQDEIDSNGGGDGYLENTATADSKESEEDTDDATVPVDQNPAISIDKVTVIGDVEGDNWTGVHAGDDVVWRYTVTNEGNTTLSNVHVTDDNGTPGITADDFTLSKTSGYVSGDTDGDGKLDLDEIWIFEKTGTAIAGTYENTGTAYGTTGETEVSDSDDSSYTATVPSALIAPTGTTAYQYISGTAMSFEEYYKDQGGVIQYGVKGGKISQTNPGVFFYFTGASGEIQDGDNDGEVDIIKVEIKQAKDSVLTSAFKPLNNSNIQLFKVIDSGPGGTPDGVVNSYDTLQSVKLGSNSIKVNATTGDVEVSFKPADEGVMYVLSVKYDTTKVVGNSVGTNPGSWPTVHYDFETWVNGSYAETYDGGIALAPKPVNTMMLDGDAGDGAHAIRAAQAKAVYKAALKFWSGEGFDVSALKKGSVEIADLGKMDDDWVLGTEQGGHITIDDDAAGHGWSLGIGAVAPNKVDLFSVLVHEMGHVLGQTDGDMGGLLAVGERDLPMSHDDAPALPLPATLLGVVGTTPAPTEAHFG